MFSSVVMGALLVTFFVYGPKAIGGGVDRTFAILLGLGVVFVWWSRRRPTSTFNFAGRDVRTEAPAR
jgi:hypothetical protein